MKRLAAMLISIIMLFSILPETEIQAACAHDWEEWSVWVNATCSTEGYETRSCKKCYETESRNIPATGIHRWTEWEAVGELCADGKYSRHCKECYKEETSARKGNGNHLYSAWQTITKPDCVNVGKKYRFCYNCYKFFYEDIPSRPNAHDWGNWHINYSKNKRIERICYSCGKVEVKKVTIYPTKKTLKKGKSFTLKIKKHISGDKISKFISSNKKVATVSKKGKVTARKKGKAKITVKMKSGCKATCTVTVK